MKPTPLELEGAARYPFPMRKMLSYALAQRVGQTVTVEMAREMLRELFPDKSPTPATFGEQQYKEYTFRVELFRDIVDELHPLHQAHYAETEVFRAGIPLEPNYENAIERERSGGLLQITARTGAGELVGHIRGYLTLSLHTCTLIASEDAFFIVPAHRRGFMAARLLQFYEKCVVAAGAREIYLDAKLVNRADVLAKYLKYQPVATKFAKVITTPTKE